MNLVLVTVDWLINGEVVQSETAPVSLAIVSGIEKTAELMGPLDEGDRLTVRLSFDPGLIVPPAPA